MNLGHRVTVNHINISLTICSLSLLGGCAGLMDDVNARQVDWRRVNNVESNAQKVGAQIIWLRYPEKNVIAPAVGSKADKSN